MPHKLQKGFLLMNERMHEKLTKKTKGTKLEHKIECVCENYKMIIHDLLKIIDEQNEPKQLGK